MGRESAEDLEVGEQDVSARDVGRVVGARHGVEIVQARRHKLDGVVGVATQATPERLDIDARRNRQCDVSY
jgi:hypothetical protein